MKVQVVDCLLPDSKERRSNLSLAHRNLQIFLLHKPHVVRFEIRVRVRKPEVKFAYQLWNQLAHLHHRDIFAETSPCTVAELEEERY